MKWLAVALAVVASALAWALPGRVEASCVATTLSDRVARSSVIIHGRIARAHRPWTGGTVVTVNVIRALKGDVGKAVTVVTAYDGRTVTSVDYRMQTGEEHTLYLHANSAGTLVTNACTGSHPGGPRPDEINLLQGSASGSGGELPGGGAGAPDTERPSGTAGQFRIWPWLVAPVLVAYVTVLSAGGRRRRA